MRRSWDAVLDAVSQVKRVAWTQLVDAQVQALAGRTLTLAFAHPGTMRAFQGGSSPDFVKDALRDVLGLDVDLHCVPADGSASPSPSAPVAGSSAPEPPTAVAPPPYDGFAPGDEAEPEDPDAPPPPSDRVRGEEAALELVKSELGGRVVGTLGES